MVKNKRSEIIGHPDMEKSRGLLEWIECNRRHAVWFPKLDCQGGALCPVLLRCSFRGKVRHYGRGTPTLSTLLDGEASSGGPRDREHQLSSQLAGSLLCRHRNDPVGHLAQQGPRQWQPQLTSGPQLLGRVPRETCSAQPFPDSSQYDMGLLLKFK